MERLGLLIFALLVIVGVAVAIADAAGFRW